MVESKDYIKLLENFGSQGEQHLENREKTDDDVLDKIYDIFKKLYEFNYAGSALFGVKNRGFFNRMWNGARNAGEIDSQEGAKKLYTLMMDYGIIDVEGNPIDDWTTLELKGKSLEFPSEIKQKRKFEEEDQKGTAEKARKRTEQARKEAEEKARQMQQQPQMMQQPQMYQQQQQPYQQQPQMMQQPLAYQQQQPQQIQYQQPMQQQQQQPQQMYQQPPMQQEDNSIARKAAEQNARKKAEIAKKKAEQNARKEAEMAKKKAEQRAKAKTAMMGTGTAEANAANIGASKVPQLSGSSQHALKSKSKSIVKDEEEKKQKLPSSKTVQQVFNEVAEEWGRDPKTMKKFVEQLEADFIDNIDDLANLDMAQLKDYKIPTGVFNRLRIKIHEHRAIVLASGQKTGETQFTHKECWTFYEVEYGEVRTLEGCKNLSDLPETANDALNAEIIAKCAGIEPQNIKRFNKMTTKQIGDVFLDGVLRFGAIKKSGGRTFLLIYIAGHGFGDQQQYFLVNDATHNLVPMEQKLRVLAKGCDTNIIAFYDCCRSNISKFPALSRGDGEYDMDIDLVGDDYCYMHICTQPLKAVDAKSRLAETLIRHLNNKAEEDKDNLIQIPVCFAGLKGVENTQTGDVYSIRWNVDRK